MNRCGSVNKNQNRINVKFMRFDWWELVDSNHRSIKQQIYSLSPLATREHAHIQFFAVTDCLYILPLGGVFVNCFLQLFQKRS